MVNDIVIHHEAQIIEVVPIFEVYELVCSFQDFPRIPTLTNIYNQYNCAVEARLASLHASIYSDDFYDGRPGSVPSPQFFPDAIRHDLSNEIGMNKDLTMEDIKKVLDDFHMCYIDHDTIRNKPILGVW